jgi:RNA polymerase sigma-70 factor (ECF subfamily)
MVSKSPRRKTSQKPLRRPSKESRAASLEEQKRAKSRQEDSDLIKEALAGSQDAYANLMNKYHDAIYSLIYRMIRNKEETEDLTQEAFIKAFSSLKNFSEEFAFSTWLYKIASNNCIDFIRKRKLKTYSIDKPIESDESDFSYELADTTYAPDRNLIEEQQKRAIQEAINSLPDKYRIVIVMRHNEEKSYEEISEFLKLPLGTVKAHIFRAREILNKYLKDKLEM